MKKVLTLSIGLFLLGTTLSPLFTSAQIQTDTDTVLAGLQAQIVLLTKKIDALEKQIAILGTALKEHSIAIPATNAVLLSLPSNMHSSVKILSPNGGEVFQAGLSITVRWESADMIADTGRISAAFVDEHGVNAYVLSDAIDTGSASMTIPKDIYPGFYRLRLFCSIKKSEGYCSPDGTLATNSKAEDFSDGTPELLHPALLAYPDNAFQDELAPHIFRSVAEN